MRAVVPNRLAYGVAAQYPKRLPTAIHLGTRAHTIDPQDRTSESECTIVVLRLVRTSQANNEVVRNQIVTFLSFTLSMCCQSRCRAANLRGSAPPQHATMRAHRGSPQACEGGCAGASNVTRPQRVRAGWSRRSPEGLEMGIPAATSRGLASPGRTTFDANLRVAGRKLGTTVRVASHQGHENARVPETPE
jgi:hypothetical protein